MTEPGKTQKLITMLGEATEFLRTHGEEHWAKCLADCADEQSAARRTSVNAKISVKSLGVIRRAYGIHSKNIFRHTLKICGVYRQGINYADPIVPTPLTPARLELNFLSVINMSANVKRSHC